MGYEFCYGNGASECAKAAFDNGEGNVVSLDKNLSRKKVVRVLQPEIKKWAAKQ